MLSRRTPVAVFGLRREERLLEDGAAGGGGIFEEVLRSSTGVGGVLATGDMRPATLPLRCSIIAFCFCFTVIMDLTCSIALGLSRWTLKPMTTGEMGVEAGSSGFGLTSMRRG